MSRQDRARRAVSLTLAVALLLLVPQLAFATFSSSKAPTLSVSSARLVTPAAVTGTYACRTGTWGLTEGADVSVTGFALSGQPSGVTYAYTLYRGTSQQAATTTTAKQASLSTGLDSTDWSANTTYRLTIVARLKTWTASEYSKTFTCGGFNPTTGSL